MNSLLSILLVVNSAMGYKVGKVVTLPSGDDCIKLGPGRYICKMVTDGGNHNCYYRDTGKTTETDCEDYEKVLNE